MPKALAISGFVVGVLAVLLFGADLAIGYPFARAAPIMNIGFVLGGAILCYLAWSAWKDAD